MSCERCGDLGWFWVWLIAPHLTHYARRPGGRRVIVEAPAATRCPCPCPAAAAWLSDRDTRPKPPEPPADILGRIERNRDAHNAESERTRDDPGP